MDNEFWKLLQTRLPNVFNPWRDIDVHDRDEFAARDRVQRLTDHLHPDGRVNFLLIGEAPGYRGCHFSGIPFTCEKQIADGMVPRVKPERFTKREIPYSEASATVIWRTLHELNMGRDTCMWNAFPWHPHVEDLPMSNRTPTPHEVHAGAPLLAMVIQHFPYAQVIAVGNIAASMLSALKVPFTKVRHPSMGGARVFQEQMEELIRRRISIMVEAAAVHAPPNQPPPLCICDYQLGRLTRVSAGCPIHSLWLAAK